MKDSALIIFAKNPIEGMVKTRLAAEIGNEKAMEVYHQLLERCREVSHTLDSERYLYYSHKIEKGDQWDERLFNKKLQEGTNLGERMANAFHTALNEEGFKKVVLIGSDCYDLDREMLEKALDALNYSDLVLGPANDGGYYLVGLRKHYPELFRDIEWSTSNVLSDTLMKARELELSYFLLEELIDLDTFDDLKKSGYPYQI